MRAWLSTALICSATLLFAPAALADSTQSSNWAGYAVHRSGVSFRQVSGTWTEPNAACSPGRPTFSAMWVGLGGYRANADALEQVGTELDCTTSGQAVTSTWYELVPAPSTSFSLPVSPGDVMRATVTVVGHRVTISLQNLTDHQAFRRTLHGASIDVSSAEWIVEAPSECVSAFACQTLPLADFGTTAFNSAEVITRRGRAGTIISPVWHRTRIDLTPGGSPLSVYHQQRTAGGVAKPSPLGNDGSEFAVTYYATGGAGDRSAMARAAGLRSRYLRH
jgi:hypothetical protein